MISMHKMHHTRIIGLYSAFPSRRDRARGRREREDENEMDRGTNVPDPSSPIPPGVHPVRVHDDKGLVGGGGTTNAGALSLAHTDDDNYNDDDDDGCSPRPPSSQSTVNPSVKPG
jgi:hypothetical protein